MAGFWDIARRPRRDDEDEVTYEIETRPDQSGDLVRLILETALSDERFDSAVEARRHHELAIVINERGTDRDLIGVLEALDVAVGALAASERTASARRISQLADEVGQRAERLSGRVDAATIAQIDRSLLPISGFAHYDGVQYQMFLIGKERRPLHVLEAFTRGRFDPSREAGIAMRARQILGESSPMVDRIQAVSATYANDLWADPFVWRVAGNVDAADTAFERARKHSLKCLRDYRTFGDQTASTEFGFILFAIHETTSALVAIRATGNEDEQAAADVELRRIVPVINRLARFCDGVSADRLVFMTGTVDAETGTRIPVEGVEPLHSRDRGRDEG